MKTHVDPIRNIEQNYPSALGVDELGLTLFFTRIYVFHDRIHFHVHPSPLQIR
jgi:hypothetical protein